MNRREKDCSTERRRRKKRMHPQEKQANLLKSIAQMIRQSKKTKIAEHLNGEEETLKQVWLPEWIVSELEDIEEFLRFASE